MKTTFIQTLCLVGLSGGLAGLLAGCASDKENVLAVTGTVIGVQIHQKDTDKTPELKVGYVRSEFAYVPTDKRADPKAPGGTATNSAEVLMEINAGGSVTLGSVYQGAVYQRLAVGRVAVSQPGVAFMMAKDDSGKTDAATARAVSEAVQGKDNAESIATRVLSNGYNQDAAILKDLRAKKLTSAPPKANGHQFNVGDSAADYADALAAEKGDTIFNILNKPSHAGDFRDIIDKLQVATK